MFYDRELTFLQKTFSKLRLQNLIFPPDADISPMIDKKLMKQLLDERSSHTFYDFFPDIVPRTVYRVTDMFSCRYLFFLLPYCDRPTVFLVGPYLYDDISPQHLPEVCERMGISPKQLKDIEYYFASIPIIRDENCILSVLTTFGEFIWDGIDRFSFSDISRTHFAVSKKLYDADAQASDPHAIDTLEMRYRFENELISAVEHGNLGKAEQMMANIPILAFEMRIPDQLRSIKNYCIIMNTLFRKAVENGGVHPVYINALSSEFARRIESLHAVSMAQKLMPEITKAYCELVKEHATKNYSPMIKKAVLKIESDLLGDLSLKSFSESSKVSPEYFSAAFKRETGSTLTQFVKAKRIETAKHLLRNSDLQIQTVAQHCGIYDFHYFCRIFKQITGITPSEYRNSRSFR